MRNTFAGRRPEERRLVSEDADYIVKRLSYPASECTCEGQSRWLPLLLALIAVNVVLWLFHLLFD